ncbi:hypothetical protein BGW80DRAFT_1447943 [Lactifluus volemus]|nr:hypothetical protein BGW80DRAFT_1447943 [Lactifluus volemus]
MFMLERFDVDALQESNRSLHTIEALVPSSPNSPNTSPQKLNGSHFFSVGRRTLVIYMKKKGVFRVLEPVVGKINERTKAPVSLSSRLGWRQPRSEWFRVYRGFEIMDLSGFKSVTIPQRDDANHVVQWVCSGLARTSSCCATMNSGCI